MYVYPIDRFKHEYMLGGDANVFVFVALSAICMSMRLTDSSNRNVHVVMLIQ